MASTDHIRPPADAAAYLGLGRDTGHRRDAGEAISPGGPARTTLVHLQCHVLHADDIVEQDDRALAYIADAHERASSSPDDVVRATHLVPDRADSKRAGTHGDASSTPKRAAT